MSDTPRTYAGMVEMITGDGPVKTRTKWVHSSVSMQLERQLNTITANALALSQANAELRSRIRRLEEALDTLTLVVGLTPIAGNKEALQEALNDARLTLASKEANP